MTPRTYTLDIEGKSIQIEFNSLAEQANGSVFVQMGGTLVLVTAVMAKKDREGVDFFPLTVDYEEKYYAAGKIGGSRFMKREGRPSDAAILSARLIDRAIRPLFPQSLRKDIQVIATVLSFDGKNDADVLAMLGASLALGVSDIPWKGPIGALRLAFDTHQNKWITNPTYEERETTLGDIVFSGCLHPEKKNLLINMIEAGFDELSREKANESVDTAGALIQQILEFQQGIIQKEGKEKLSFEEAPGDDELLKKVSSLAKQKIEDTLFGADSSGTKEKMREVNELKEDIQREILKESGDEAQAKQAGELFEKILDETVHEYAIEKEMRPDGRKLDEIRPITARTRILPRTHGSAVFTRGTTKALSIVTLGAPGDQQLLEGMELSGKKRFMHHYNFPPYSSGETRPLRGPGRREIGHGMLAERALEPLLPSQEEFPYTIRTVTEILSSNGSTSMASVSAASMALFDAGVPIRRIATGISIGLMSREDGTYKLLTDIQGPEDHHGDMDFKVAGTSEGITAIQMDVKVYGITAAIFKEAIKRAEEARAAILQEMQKVLPEPQPSLSPYAPRIVTIHIDPEKIGDVIGPGGKIINAIIDETGVNIDIEDDGTVFITSPSQEGLEAALQRVKDLTHEVTPGEVYEGTVRRVTDFGAFVEILPGQDGLIHISRLAQGRVEKTTDVVNLGDKVTVKVIEIDEQGRINLTLKDKKSGTFIEKESPPRSKPPRRPGRRF